MSDRLNFIRKTIRERGLNEILTVTDAFDQGVIQLGKNVKYKDGTIIGTDGFGFERNEEGKFEKFPHYGKVIIGDNVDIGANCTIDRGNMSNTVIGSGTKIDNGVHIAHNCTIGNDCVLGPHCVILGGVQIGDRCMIWSNSTIKEHVTIGNDIVVGACSFINTNVPDGATIFGIPGRIQK